MAQIDSQTPLENRQAFAKFTTRAICAIAVTALLTGCATFPTGNMGLQSMQPDADGFVEQVDEFGNIQLVQAQVSDQTAGHRPPTEKSKTSLPEYRVEPPDVLLIQAIRMAPKAPYRLKPMDLLAVAVVGTLPDQPIAGTYQVSPSGNIDLGPAYGPVEVKGLTTTEAKGAVADQLQNYLAAPEVSLSLLETAGQQQIAGEHLVGPDGTITLGAYGTVYVSGMTLGETRAAIEEHLSQYLEEPEISVDVYSFNSKVYYIITEGAGLGDNVVRMPITGNETALDAIATIGGLQRVSSKKIWIARPGPSGMKCDQNLPIDWYAITKGGATATNYQLLPGDRLFIAEDRLVATDSTISKVTAPFERVFGFMLLGVQTIQAAQRFPEGQRTGF